MDTTETLRIENKGNAPGKFKWELDSKTFFVHPKEGEVASKGFMDV